MAHEITIRCETCSGTGSIESEDSTDDRWWDCALCKGSGFRTIADRRTGGRLAHVAMGDGMGSAQICYCEVGRNHA